MRAGPARLSSPIERLAEWQLDPAFAMVANRMPPQLRRGFLSGGLPAEGETDDLYKRSYANMVKMVGLLHRSGIRRANWRTSS